MLMTALFESEPERNPPDENWFEYEVYRRVREALFALPTYFRSDTSIEGILATDIFTLNAAFGATIVCFSRLSIRRSSGAICAFTSASIIAFISSVIMLNPPFIKYDTARKIISH